MTLRLIELAGSPREMGYAYGEQLADQTRAFAEERIRLAEKDAPALGRAGLLELARACLDAQAEHAPAVHEEFCGIAEGAGLSQEELLIGNGYTDFRDAAKAAASSGAAGCTSFIVKPPAAADGYAYVGQTWDMHASAEPFVVALRRKPDDGPETLTLTTAGCLALVGMNECGLAVGNNNLTPVDAKPGMIYLAMIHDFLSRRSLEEARRCITHAPRASGHNYYMADGEGRVDDVETTAERWASVLGPADVFAHANHYEAITLKGLEREPPTANSLARRERLTARLRQAAGAIDFPKLREILSYRREGDEGSLSRHEDIRTCAAAVLCPERRTVWFCQGPPDVNEFVEWRFG